MPIKQGEITVKKNQQFITEITGTGSQGEGVARIENMAVFVPYALLGETVKVHIVKVLKNYAYGKLIEVIKPSPNRTEPKCSVFYKCGGCNMQHADYRYELQFKTNHVSDCLKRIGGIDTEVLPCIPSPETEHYRNKGQFAVTKDGIGFYSQRSHNLVDSNSCLIQKEICSEIIGIIREYMKTNNVPPYDEETHTGKIRNIFIRQLSGGTMVCITVTDKNLPNLTDLTKELVTLGAASVMLNINNKRTNVQLGEHFIPLYGDETLTDTIGDIEFKVSPNSFYQINSKQTEQLYKYAVSLAGLTGNETVFDLYCGIGTIGLFASKYAKKVIGVEIVEKAVENARNNALANGITNAQFLCGKAEDVIKDIGKADVVMLDPPRKGCDDKLLKTVKEIAPKTIVYISCNPATLARDLKTLKGYGYCIDTVQPFDMFPRTFHVECVVKLQR